MADTAPSLDAACRKNDIVSMSTTNLEDAQSPQAKDKPQSAEELKETISQQVTKGLSQPPSRAQVPPGTAAEEMVQ